MKNIYKLISLFFAAAGLAVIGCSPPPLGINAACDGGDIVVDWAEYENPDGLTSFDVLRSTYPGVPGDVIGAEITGTSFTDTDVTEGVAYFYTVDGTQLGMHCGAMPEPTPSQLASATAAACSQNLASNYVTDSNDLSPPVTVTVAGGIPHDIPDTANEITIDVQQVALYDLLDISVENFLDFSSFPYLIYGGMGGMLGLDDSGWMIGLSFFSDVSGAPASLENGVVLWSRYDVADLDKVSGSGNGYASFCTANPIDLGGGNILPPFATCWTPANTIAINVDSANVCP